jgi:hypothetical protein
MKRKTFFLLLILLGFGHGIATAQSGDRQADIKAVFIYNFTRYIDWTMDGQNADFIIGVVGNSPVSVALTEIAKTNTVGNRRIVVQTFSKPEDIQYCNILFIPQKTTFPLQSILDKAGRGVLTVSEEAGLAKKGTAFNFVVVNDKIKFETNLKAIDAAGLKAGSQLLKLAILVD